MAYQQKYYKEIVSQGHRWKLVILQDTKDALTPVEIGQVLQGLRLSVQGDQADIDTPIVKTSLVMTFVDAPDLDEERKCGYWEEFYTSSATEYKVELYKDGVIEWSGYITPDSFAEDLQYRGSVSITARDNLGSLQDEPYRLVAPTDSELVSLNYLLSNAMKVIKFPMRYISSQAGARAKIHTAEIAGYLVDLYEVLFNNNSFNNKSWYDVIESVLYSTGLVLRYVGGNKYMLSTIRDIPMYDKSYYWDVPVIDVQFAAYGHRELNPAVKSIREEVNFEIQDSIVNTYTNGDSFGEKTTYSYGIDSDEGYNYQMPVHTPIAGLFRVADGDRSVLLNPFAYKLNATHKYGKGGEIHNNNILYVCSNLFGYGYIANSPFKVSFKRRIPAGKYKISFEVNKAVALYDNETTIGYYKPQDGEWWDFGYEARFRGDDGRLLILNNRAGTTTKDPVWENLGGMDLVGYHSVSGKSYPVSVESPVLDVDVAGEIEIKLLNANMDYNGPVSESRGSYLGIADFKVVAIDNGGASIMNTLRINTEYNENNNVIINRKPEYAGNISDIIYWGQVQNGIYVDEGSNFIGTEQWVFNVGDNPVPLSVLIHQQILAYYAKPNNLLTGELVVDNPVFNAQYRWKGKNHIITSGTLNVLSGRMENVTLREFARYDFMWETWVEQDTLKVDYVGGDIQVRVHSNKALTTSHLVLPSWISGSIADAGNGVYDLTLHITQNDTGADRVAIIEVDTALVKVEQVIAGDYGIDYGFDYS